MPSRKMADGDFKDIAHPINSETRSKIQEAIFKEYEKNIGDEWRKGPNLVLFLLF